MELRWSTRRKTLLAGEDASWRIRMAVQIDAVVFWRRGALDVRRVGLPRCASVRAF